MVHENSRSADFRRFRRLGNRLDTWALASEATVAKEVFAAIASDGECSFEDLVKCVDAGTLDGWDATWVARVARIIALQPHEVELSGFAERALSLSVPELPKTPSTLAVRKLHVELLFNHKEFTRASEALSEDPELSNIYHGYLRVDLLNPFVVGSGADSGKWLEGFNAPFVEGGLSPVSVEPAAATPFDGLASGTSARKVEEGPLVSVIVTTFNPNPVEIRTAVKSILQQTWRNLEVLLVDDHSKEDAIATLEEIAAEDPRIRLIRLPVNGGTYRARNAGIRAATGKYLTGQDTDDWSHPERIARQVAVLEQEPDLPGVTTAANRTDDQLVKLAPGNNPHRRCEVSLMLRVDTARAIGGYLPVRKAADSEFRERLEAWFGAPVRLIDVPLYMIRMSAGSLSRADFRPGWSHHARRAFWSSYKHWHNTAPRKSLDIDESVDVAGIPSTTPSRIAGWEWDKHRSFDVCIAADWRGATPQQRAALDELKSLADTNLAIAVLHLDTPWGAGREPRALHPEVQEMITAGKVARVFLDQATHVELLLIRQPETMDFARRAPGELRCGRVVLVGHGDLAHRADEMRAYDPVNADTTARTIFGVAPRWTVPEADAVEGVGAMYGISVEEDRYPLYIDAARFAGPRWRKSLDAPLVVGCTATNDELAWPAAGALREVFPVGSVDEVRILGDARGALRELAEKRLPTNWVQFRESETDIATFWRVLDVAVVFDRDGTGPTVDRAVLEALASGTIVVTNESRAEAYSGSVIVSVPEEALSAVRTLADRPEDWEDLCRRRAAFVRSKANSSVIGDYVRRQLNDALAGAESYV